MNKEFIPYEQALALKELGFNFEDYDILGFYSKKYGVTTHSQLTKNDEYNPAPLYQQAFRWFREKYNIFTSVDVNYCYKVYFNDEFFEESINYNSHEEAELECLKKLIEIVKEK